MDEESEHALEDHHAAVGKSAAAHSHHVKRVKDGKKHHEPINRHPRGVKAAPQQAQPKGVIAPKQAPPIKAGATAQIQAPQGAGGWGGKGAGGWCGKGAAGGWCG